MNLSKHHVALHISESKLTIKLMTQFTLRLYTYLIYCYTIMLYCYTKLNKFLPPRSKIFS